MPLYSVCLASLIHIKPHPLPARVSFFGRFDRRVTGDILHKTWGLFFQKGRHDGNAR